TGISPAHADRPINTLRWRTLSEVEHPAATQLVRIVFGLAGAPTHELAVGAYRAARVKPSRHLLEGASRRLELPCCGRIRALFIAWGAPAQQCRTTGANPTREIASYVQCGQRFASGAERHEERTG